MELLQTRLTTIGNSTTNQTYIDAVADLKTRNGNYKIIVEYGTAYDGFAAVDGQTLKVHNSWISSTDFTTINVRDALFAMLALPPGDKDLSGNITIINISYLFEAATPGYELTANYSGAEAVGYHWSKDGTPIDGKTSNKYTATEAGSYTVTVSLAGYTSKTSVAAIMATRELTLSDIPINVVYMKTALEEEPEYLELLQTRFTAIGESTVTANVNLINNLKNRNGNYKIVVEYGDANEYDDFVAQDGQTLKAHNSWISSTDVTGAMLRAAFNAMLA